MAVIVVARRSFVRKFGGILINPSQEDAMQQAVLTSSRPAKIATANARFLSDLQFAERIGVHRITIWRRSRAEPAFPKPVRLSAGCTRWRVADIEAWEAALP
ncbi:helix-turn-helix transcriptional regulator [Mesorhizobium sp. IMUNJ 23232]|uniref:helix-turn-helix transcriptional regulator n=1 Tax=Mesorhizobium sp. IMUNJ 23232 TaxID=3376064 RepID=UPI0037A8463B